MKKRLLFAMVLLVAAFTMPIFAVAGGGVVVVEEPNAINNCRFTCSTGWSGNAWASSARACSDGCRALCNVCVNYDFSTSPNN